MENKLQVFTNKSVFISGGTGSFGNAVVDKLLKTGVREVRIFSRDEKKQDDMRKHYADDRLKFFLGDVRDINSVINGIRGSDYMFHAAALKQVPSCEFFPIEAVKTNILGTENVLEAAINEGVEKVVCLSTDKAVYPINAMGMSKALMEKIIVAKSRNSRNTKICITRYGNVMASRGSVIPLFYSQIENNLPITITDPNMTRFMMTLSDAVDLVLYAFNHGNAGEIFVQKSPAASIEVLVQALLETLNAEKHPVTVIGTRHGEKKYETLLSKEEKAKSIDLGDYFMVPPDNRTLNYEKYFTKGQDTQTLNEEYNSDNTYALNVREMKKLLNCLSIMSGQNKNEHSDL